MFRFKPKRDLFPSLNGFVDGVDEFKAFFAGEAVDQMLAVVIDAVDYMFVVGLVTKAIHIGWIN